jgi:murein DD-endopeptidase MepM/ murein hydrolase activator NlpD
MSAPQQVMDPLAAFAPAPAARRVHPEIWAWIAFALLAALIAIYLYLAVRPGGIGPVIAYAYGPDLLGLAALATGFVGLVWSALHRPFLRRRRLPAFVCLALVIGAQSLRLPYPSSHEGRPSRTCFRLPVAGEWTVFWGGESREANRLAGLFPDRRWGLDLVVTRDGRSHDGDGYELQDYYAYGQDVLAPADGTVVRVQAGMRDTQPGMFERGTEPFGNHVVIEVGAGEHVFLCHLQPGSIAVAAGQHVARGQRIARVGNSGYSAVTPEPHLAIHLQDTPVAHRGEAIPWRFCDYSADGVLVPSGLPLGGIGRDGAFYGQRVTPVD